MTESTTPTALQEELGRCVLALGVPQETLQQQQTHLEKASKKLSAFLSAVHSIVPESFSSDYESPCWESDVVSLHSPLIKTLQEGIYGERKLKFTPEQVKYVANKLFSKKLDTSELLCLPHFFIAGFPKSATTSLAYTMIAHPDLKDSMTNKEPHWWTRAPIISPDSDLLRLNVVRYLMYFSKLVTSIKTGVNPLLLGMDASQSTLWDSNFVMSGHDFCSTPAAISHVLPHAKFIVLMREPSSRLYSYYLWSCQNRHGNSIDHWPKKMRKDIPGEFHRQVVEALSHFKECLQHHTLYTCTNKFTFGNGTSSNLVFHCGSIEYRMIVSIYYIHIAKFLQFFPREQFLFLKMEEMSQTPIKFMQQVTDFLGIDPLLPSVAETINFKMNTQKLVKVTMHEDTRRVLQQFFAPYNKKLAELVGDDRFLWDYS